MFLRLSDDQVEIRDLVRRFAQNEIAPHAERWDEESHFPREIFKPLAELGLSGLLVPEELGGSELSRLTGAIIYEEIGKADMSTAIWLAVHNMVAGLITRFGNQEQRQRWVGAMASGELLGAFCLSEVHAGSDAANVQATATRDGDDYLLNGTKYWVTSAGVADLYAVMMRTSDTGAHGISTFIVPKGSCRFQYRQGGAQDGTPFQPDG